MTHFLLRQTSVVQGLAATLGFSATLAYAQEAGTALPARVAVRVRLSNIAQVSPGGRDAATAVATSALGSAVQISWRDRAGMAARHPGELIIRLLRSSESTPRPSTFALGEAVIDVDTGAGVFATIYVDRVEKMAERSKADTAVLLGRAIAHELGHLLLGTNDHSESGLMRPNWTPDDIRRNRGEDWLLTKEDAEAIRKRLR